MTKEEIADWDAKRSRELDCEIHHSDRCRVCPERAKERERVDKMSLATLRHRINTAMKELARRRGGA